MGSFLFEKRSGNNDLVTAQCTKHFAYKLHRSVKGFSTLAQSSSKRLGELERVILQETCLRFRSTRRMGAVLLIQRLKKILKYHLPLQK